MLSIKGDGTIIGIIKILGINIYDILMPDGSHYELVFSK